MRKVLKCDYRQLKKKKDERKKQEKKLCLSKKRRWIGRSVTQQFTLLSYWEGAKRA
jgi:hypothetical protein